MGIDLLDLKFRLEREFEIQLDRNFFEEFGTFDPTWDMQVCTVVDWVVTTIESHDPDFEAEESVVFQRVRRQISDCLGVSPVEVTPHAWLVRDLGLS